MTKIRLAILALFIISWQFIAAQVYPVQVTTQLAAPYSLYLPDYVLPGSERLVVTALLGDVSRPELNVRFRMRIEGQGIVVETKPEYIPAPISLQGGVPLRMISSDLAPYFEPRNLNFIQGLTQREFEQRGGKLPEGLYSFCFEVLEYNRGVKISNAGCANAWMILNDPPIINIPRQDEKLKPLNPQNVVIQWTPRHTGSPNSAFNTEYEVTIVEVWPSTRNPNDAMLTSPPIFQATTQSTMLIYGPAETPLEQGRRYAFRVRAKGKVGIDELDLFKNQGYSEVYSFTYGDACDLPAEISGESFTTRFNLKWESKFNHTSFKVRYRKQGTTDWYVEKSTFNDASITSLKPSTVYEYQVAGACGWYEGDYTTVATIKTKDEPERTYSCGLPLETFNLDPSKLTGSLKVGDVIDAGDFDVELTKVTGSAGNFSGEGIVVMPMMNKVKVKAEFSNITVAGVPTATDYRMVKGFMNVTGGGIEVIPAGVLNAMDKLVETLDIVDSALTIVEAYIPKKGPDPVSFAADTLIKIDANIIAVVRDPNSGKVIVTSANGKTTELAPGKNYALTDKDGTGYVVDLKGGVTKTTADVATKASQRKYNFSVQFSNVVTSAAPGGFDRYTGNTIFSSTYELLGKTYFVPWKASAQNGTGTLTAILTDRSLDASKVTFEMIDVQATSTLVGDRWTFNITSATAGKIVAYYPSTGPGDKEQILGKVNIQGFDPKPYKLVIVKDADGKYPFTNKDVKILTDSLNRIYGQALVNWQVSYEERDFNIDKSFDAGNSGLLSNYTADMRKVISAYGTLQKDAYYLFVIDKPTNSGDVVGFMPRSQQAGFIYTNGNTTPALFIHTAAHELGHGVFNLKHIFDEFTGLGEKSTKNLMDYTDNSSHHFMRFQWERIHDPVTVIGLFEDDEAGAYRDKLAYRCLPVSLTKVSSSEYYYDLRGKVILLNSKYEPYAFVGNYDSEGNKKGALAIIRRIADGKLYFPAKNDQAYPYYYARIDENTFDANDWFSEFVEDNTKVPTIVLIDAKCSYEITRAGSANVDGKTESCDCFSSGSNAGLTMANSESKIINRTGEEIDLSSLKNLLDGKVTINDAKLGVIQKSVAYLYLTSEANKEGIEEVAKTIVPEGIIKLWLHKGADGKWIVREGGNVDRINTIYQSKWGSDFRFDLNVAIQGKNLDLTAIATASYKIADWLSSKVGKLSIPESWWNCDNTEANGVSKDDPNDFNPPWFIDIVKYILSPTAFVVEQLIQMIPPESEYAKLKALSPTNLQLSLMAGVWDGFVGLLTALPDAIKMATMFTADDPTAQRSKAAMEKLIADNGGGVIGTGKMIFNAIADQFDINKPCVFAHSVGQVGFDVIVAVFTAGTATTASRFASTIKTIITTLDKLDVLGNAIGGVAGASLKVAFKGTNKILTFSIRQGAKFIEVTIENGKYIFKVFKTTVDVAGEIDWMPVKMAKVKMLDGSELSIPILIDPTKQIEGAVYRVKQILKDENGADLKNEKSETVIEVENVETKETDIAIIKTDNVVELTTIRQDLKGSVYPGTNVMYLERIIEFAGKKIKGVFPKFEYSHRMNLSEDLYLASDYKQFTAATKHLKAQIKLDPDLAKKFTGEQLEDINNGLDKIRGFIWHHNEEPGVMELVDEILHDTARHTGGKKIWGGKR